MIEVRLIKKPKRNGIYFHNEILFKHTDIDDCLLDPCKNNGTCTDLVNNYQCDCVAGFNGTNCEDSKHSKCMPHFLSFITLHYIIINIITKVSINSVILHTLFQTNRLLTYRYR